MLRATGHARMVKLNSVIYCLVHSASINCYEIESETKVKQPDMAMLLNLELIQTGKGYQTVNQCF